MNLQSLAIIFVIIVLPMSLILTSYTQSQVDTLDLQIKYDVRLRNSTYDALKAFQLNTINSDTSDLANSKLRDIEASVNTFFTSLATTFNMSGYNKDILKDYVPALVYTMYDGYYIYSPYTNTLDTTKSNQVIDSNGNVEMKSDKDLLSENEDATYKDGDKVYGLKPYIYYSCRYVKGDSYDFVITYTLDNYITIQGKVNGMYVNDAGYLLDNITVNGNDVKYRNIEIEKETLRENIYDPTINEDNKLKNYEYVKINGVKYYKDDNDNWFNIMNNERLDQGKLTQKTTSAIEYYKEAEAFSKRVKETYNLDDEIRANNAVDKNGNQITEFGNLRIFDFGSMNISDGSIEDPDSNFNQHRLDVIKYCIESELSIAIANYNNYGGSTIGVAFQMPKLDETEWDRIVENVSVISFLQGLSIGGKIYNGYSIVTNNKTQEVVKEDSIYLLTNDGQYHRPTDKSLVDNSSILQGFLNIDFEIKKVILDEDSNKFYMKHGGIGCYDCIVGMTNMASLEKQNVVGKNYYAYITETAEGAKSDLLAQKYFTALGRERYSMYRTNNNQDEMRIKFGFE